MHIREYYLAMKMKELWLFTRAWVVFGMQLGAVIKQTVEG